MSNTELTWKTKDSNVIFCFFLAGIVAILIYFNFNKQYNFYECLDQVDGNRITCAQIKIEKLEEELKK